MTQNRGFTATALLVSAFLFSGAGCAPVPKPPTDTLTLAIQERAKNPNQNKPPAGKKSKAQQRPVENAIPGSSGTIARVGEREIARTGFDSFLIRSRGVAVFEQQIGLAAAENLAQREGVTIAAGDVEFEYGLALRRLSDPLAFSPVRDFERADAERLLDSILASRHMSREEYMLTIRRNAFLRRMLNRNLSIPDEQIRAEFELVYGDRVLVRHIQLGNLADATRIKERLAAGEDFADLAVRFSTNVSTSRKGGMLDAFSLRDEHIPQAMRQSAARLSEGEVSDVVRVGEWYHILKLEKQIPAETRSFESVQEELRQRIMVRATDAEMRPMHEKLFAESDVEIHDALLFQEFRAAFPTKTNVTLVEPPAGKPATPN